jgi:hypothetical protein
VVFAVGDYVQRVDVIEAIHSIIDAGCLIAIFDEEGAAVGIRKESVALSCTISESGV